LPPDPKPPARVKATRTQWALIDQAKRGRCRGCGADPRRTTNHHLVSRSLGGDDVIDNIVPLCGSGTVGCHGAIETHPPGWRHVATAVRRSLTTTELRYALEKKGSDWLDRYYPLA
jgi:hypothetical protein